MSATVILRHQGIKGGILVMDDTDRCSSANTLI
jgi:hypothetical protein